MCNSTSTWHATSNYHHAAELETLTHVAYHFPRSLTAVVRICIWMWENYIKRWSRVRDRDRERDLLPHEIHSYSHRQLKKSQHADTVIATRRGTAPSRRKKANYCRIVKKLKTRNEPCDAVFNVSRFFATK